MRKKLTAKLIAALVVPEGKRQIKQFDTEVGGLAVRKMKSGVSTFIFEKRPKGAKAAKQITIGRCGDWSIDQARAKARELAVELASPQFLKSEAIKGATPTFAEAVALYDEMVLSNKSPNYRDKTLGSLRRYLLAPLGALKVSDIARMHLVAVVTPLMRADKHPSAQIVWEAASNVLTWAVRNDYRDDNPLIRIKPEFHKTTRDRFLTLDEVAAVWEAADALSDVHRAAVRTLILAPFRKSELLGCSWSDLNEGWLAISAERTKTKAATALYLSPFASEQLPAVRNDSDLIFTTTGDAPTRLGSKIKAKLDAQLDMPPWVFHDFRRTFSTHMNEADAPSFLIEACLNHKDGTRRGVAGIYNRAEYREQKKAVSQRWSAMVEGAVNGR